MSYDSRLYRGGTRLPDKGTRRACTARAVSSLLVFLDAGQTVFSPFISLAGNPCFSGRCTSLVWRYVFDSWKQFYQ